MIVPPSASNWSGKQVLITGAASGIGSALVDEASRRGAQVTAVDRPGVAWSGRESSHAGVVRRVECDLCETDAILAVVDQAWSETGPIDALFNNAGIAGQRKPFLEISLSDWDSVMAVNLRAAFVVGQAVARRMVERGSGAIVNTTSQLSTVASPVGSAEYVTSKGGLLQLTRAMASELAPYGVRVNAIAPGLVETPLNADVRRDSAWMAKRTAMIPMNRLAVPEEVAGVALFMASDEASYMTGASVVVDGGYTIW